MFELPSEIVEKLNRFIKKYYVNELIKGILLFITIGLLYFILVLVLENFLWFSPTNRKILFWTFIGVELFLFLKFIGIPLSKLTKLSKGITDVDASKIIGNHFPEVNDQLLNLLQLSKHGNSSELLAASIEQKSKELKPIPFQSAINFKKSLSYAKYAIIPILFFGIVTLLKGKNWFGESLDRVVNYNVAYNPPAPFYFKVLNNDLSVIQQNDFKLNVTTYGTVIPDQVALEYNGESYFLKQESINRFSYEFKNLNTSVDFKLVSGDQTSQDYSITTNPAPSISDFQMKVIAPQHTGIGNTIYENTGNALVPEGSKVEWIVGSKNSNKVAFVVDTTAVSFKNNNGKYSFSKSISKPVEYSISSSNKFISNYENLSFALDVIIDKNPIINVSKTIDTVALNKPHFYGQLSDDYGLKKLEVVYFKEEYPDQKGILNIPIKSTNYSEFIYSFPDGIDLKDADTYSFYFEVYDNDSFHGSKSSRSQTYNFKKLSEIEQRHSDFKKKQVTLDQFSKTIDDYQKSELDLENFSKFQKQTNSLSFKEKQNLETVLDKQTEQQKSLKKLSENLEKTLDELKEDENSEAIKEQLERTKLELEKNKKLIDEIKKALEKIKPESLQKKLDELQKDNKKLTKNLNQVLELTKRYYVIDKHQRVAQMLELLSEKQIKLSDDISNSPKEQQQINKEWKIVQSELDDLRKHNESLKKPMQLDDDPEYEKQIKKELDKALKDLKQSKKQEAKTKQKTAGTMLQNLADKMQLQSASSGGGDMQDLDEDLEMLRQILDNLVLFSLKQESNMNRFKSSNSNDPNYSSYIRKQNVLREHFNHIDDSLYALASRNPKVGNVVNDLVSDIDYDLSSSIEKLVDNNIRNGSTNLQYAITHSNDLALMLSELFVGMSQQQKPGQKGQKGNKSQGFQLPDIIKKQESLNEAMQQMLQGGEKKPGDSKKEESGGKEKGSDKGKAGEEGKSSTDGENGGAGESGEKGKEGQNGKQGQNGQSGESSEGGKPGAKGSKGKGGKNGNNGESSDGESGGEKGDANGKGKGDKGTEGKKGKGSKGKNGEGENEGDPGDESDYGQLFEIFKQQQQLRNQLENKLLEEGISPNEKRVLKQMEQIENDLLERGVTQETLNRMLNLKHQLFKLEKAQFQQGKDSKRKGETSKKEIISDQLNTKEQLKQYFNSTEILNRHTLPLQPEFKKKVQDYFLDND